MNLEVIIKLLRESDFASAGGIVKDSNKKIGQMLVEMEDLIPFTTMNEEYKLQACAIVSVTNLHEVMKVKEEKQVQKLDVVVGELKQAMEIVNTLKPKVDIEKSKLQLDIERQKERDLADIEKLTPITEFIPINESRKIGHTFCDVILEGNLQEVARLTKDKLVSSRFDKYLIIRNVLIVGVHKDKIFFPNLYVGDKLKIKGGMKKRKNKDQIFHSPHAYAKVVSKVLPGWAICSKQILLDNFYYFLILPDTCISSDNVPFVLGQNKYLVETWALLK